MTTSTDKLVEDAMRELKEKKKSKEKAAKYPGMEEAAGSGLNLPGDDEEMDDDKGPVREDLVGVAAKRRAMQRKEMEAGMRNVDDTDEVEGVEGAEERYITGGPESGEAGELFEPFNLDEERQRGYFDAEGNYVEKDDEDEEHTADAWLKGVEVAKIAPQKASSVLPQIPEKEKEPMSEAKIAQVKGEIGALLLPGENVVRALKRLGGGANRGAGGSSAARRAGRKSKPSAGGGGDGEGGGKRQKIAGGEGGGGDQHNKGSMDADAKQKFEKLTELTDLLMQVGEFDAYQIDKESFERHFRLFAPKAPPAGSSGGDMFGDDDGDDMFADEPKGASKGTAEASAAAAPAATAAAAPAVVDHASWSIKQLKGFLEERGVNTAGFVEKGDMVGKVRELAYVPAGYVQDPGGSAYFYDARPGGSGLYFDPASGGYYNGQTSEWLTPDGAGGFKKWG